MSGESEPLSSEIAILSEAINHEDYRYINKKNVSEGQILISDELMWQFNIYIYILICGSVSIFGTLSNTSNMIIFYQLELKDSMSVCLFALSFTDFLISCIITISRVFPIWNIFFNNEGIDPMALLYVGPEWFADSLFLCSGWILTILSLERCVCVMFPFKVKRIFTKNRAIAAVVLIHALTASSYIPIYMTHWLAWVSDEVKMTNETRLSKRRLAVLFSDDRHEIEATVTIFNSTLLPIPSLILTMGSVLLMIYGLNASSRFRDSATHTRNAGGTGQSGITLKTRKLVKVVLFLAILFIVFSIPRIIASCINVIFPEINEGGRGRNLNNFLWQLARLSAGFNASINIFVYLKINSSYQEKFRELLTNRSKSL